MNMKEMKMENGTEKKEDRRVRRTKKMLSQGLIELMQHKQVKDITVRELAERVDVNRGTFYLYYRDIFDLLERLEEDLFEQLNEVILAHRGEPVLAHIRPMLTDVFHIVAENKEICRVLLSDNGDIKFLQRLSDVIQEKLRTEWLNGYVDNETEFEYRYAFGALGFAAKKTAKGGVLIDLGGAESEEGALLLQAHTDTLGAMVAEVKANGRLRVTNLGGMRAENGETENVRVYTRGGKVYEGTLQLCNASVHVNGDYGKTERTFDTTEVLLDEAVTSADETRALGIETGDIVCFDPRTRVTASGYIKSRFLDDKLSVGILLGFAKYLRDENKQLPRRTYVHVTVYEEVGHGGAGSVPAGVTESISVDMGCVGDGLRCTERQVSICAKDSGGPYSYEVVGKLIDAAKREGADYAVDVYPHYGSDVEATLSAGYDIRHGLIGSGVYASHGYERSHKAGVLNTLKTLKGYLFV